MPATDSYPCSATRFTRAKHCQVATVMEARGQRRNARDQFIPVHCEDEAVVTRNETNAAHELLGERVTPARLMVAQPFAGEF
jgi:hypothetical protein